MMAKTASNSTVFRILLSCFFLAISGFFVGGFYMLVEKPTHVSNYSLTGAKTTPSVTRNYTVAMTNNTSSLSLSNSSSESNKTEVKKEVYLHFDPSNFSYPSHFNLSRAVDDVILLNKTLPREHLVINPHNFRYIHLPERCLFPADKEKRNNVIVLVKSFVGNFDLRNTQRLILRKIKQKLPIRQVFLLGYNETFQKRIDDESEKYGDIVQENFKDVYFNNTLKTIMAYNWVNQYCRSAAILFFIDDDYYVHYDKIVNHIHFLFKKQNTGVFRGTLAKKGIPYRRNETVWALTYEQYPYDLFPPYIGGGAYVVSHDVARRFGIAFPYVRFLCIDDAYLGIVAKKVAVDPSYDSMFDTSRTSALAKECSHNSSELINEHCPIAKMKSTFPVRRRRRPREPVSWLAILPMIIFLNVFFLTIIWCSN